MRCLHRWLQCHLQIRFWNLILVVLQFSRSVMSNSLQPHGLQHTKLPCPSPTPRAYLNSCPLSQWYHPTISFSAIPLSFCLQSFPASGSFQMSQLFASGGQSIVVSASASILPINIQDWFPLGWTGWISLQSKGFSRVFSNNTVQNHQFFGAQLSLSSNFHIHTWLLEKPYLWLDRPFFGKIMSLLLNMLSRLVITFLQRSKCLLMSWLWSSSAVILEPKKIKSLTFSTVSPSICHEVMGPDAMILDFWMLSFKPTSSLSSFTFIKRFFSSSLLSPIRVVSSAYLRLLIFLPAILIPACASSSPGFLMMYSLIRYLLRAKYCGNFKSTLYKQHVFVITPIQLTGGNRSWELLICSAAKSL